MLDIKLDTLLAVYEEKSFTKAAARLNLTQPAVSNHIRMLENEIGYSLCIHAKGRLDFTPEGEIVVNYARSLKKIYDHMCEEIANQQALLTQIRIGVTRSLENYNFIAYAIGQYMARNTDVCLKIISETMESLYGMLENYELDFIIIDDMPMNNLQFDSRLLDSERLVCFISTQNQLSGRNMISLEELKKLPLIMYFPSAEGRKRFEDALEELHESLNSFHVVMEIDNFTTAELMVKKNVGVSILPQKLSSTSGRYAGIPIENFSLFQDIYLVYRKDFSCINILNEFAQIYKEVSS